MAHGEREAAKENHRRELMSWGPVNLHGASRGPCRGLMHKQMAHGAERAQAREQRRRGAKSAFERTHLKSMLRSGGVCGTPPAPFGCGSVWVSYGSASQHLTAPSRIVYRTESGTTVQKRNASAPSPHRHAQSAEVAGTEPPRVDPCS